ncbi:MAG: cytochrome P450 [Leptolyngbyaceae bacterium]|nr:cytochrome P450 [Leptolyngbyaceae bacterium]
MKALPVSPTPHFRQVIQWILDPVGYMRQNFERCGDIFVANVLPNGKNALIFVQEPKALQYLLTHDNGKTLTAPGDANSILESLLGSQGLVSIETLQHRQRRQLVMPPFHGNRVKAYGTIIQQLTQEAIAQWPMNQAVDVRTVMQKITMRVILQAVFGLSAGPRHEALDQLLAKRLNMTSNPLSSAIIFFPWLQKDFGAWSPGYRIQQLAQQTDDLLFAEIRERRTQTGGDRIDVLSLLLAARDEDGNGLTDQELRDDLMTLLVAGHETTATALTWAIYWIHTYPEVKQKLLDELGQSPADPEQWMRAPYLDAVVNETLRIHPVGMLTFPRRVQRPLELCGYQLQPGQDVVGCIYLLHQRPDLYSAPQTFRPERFLERQFSPYEFMPFGGGVRRCVGTALAQAEMKIVLGTLLTQSNLALVNQQSVQPGRRGVTLGQRQSVKAQMLSRCTVDPKPLVQV